MKSFLTTFIALKNGFDVGYTLTRAEAFPPFLFDVLSIVMQIFELISFTGHLIGNEKSISKKLT